MTATPRPEGERAFDIAHSIDFSVLVEHGFLARPIIETVETHCSWRGSRLGARGDFTPQSLAELGLNEGRNQLVARQYAKHAERYGKTIIFACSIEHCEKLAALLSNAHGVAARPMHHERHEENQRNIEAFRRGELRALTSVSMLTTGIDIPDARTIFLARPTTSGTLLAQMIGRGCRIDATSGKTSFNVVEFVDSVGNMAEHVARADRHVGNCARRQRHQGAPRQHFFDPRGAPRFSPSGGPAGGLWYREGQTFGVELEFTRDGFLGLSSVEWMKIAESLRKALVRELGSWRVAAAATSAHGATDYDVWQVENDPSCGWEIKSPILEGHDGMLEVARACDVLKSVIAELGLKIDWRTGMHVHLAWVPADHRVIKNLIRLVKIFEPGLATLVAPSRCISFSGATYHPNAPNRFCQPISTVFSKKRITRLSSIERFQKFRSNRYTSVNLCSLSKTKTVEVRFHNGTIEAEKILLWLSLWMQIVWTAEATKPRRLRCPTDRTVIQPDGDIVELVKHYLPHTGEEFLHRLRQRRAQVAKRLLSIPGLAAMKNLFETWIAMADTSPPRTASPSGMDSAPRQIAVDGAAAVEVTQ